MKKTIPVIVFLLCISILCTACGAQKLTDGKYTMDVTLTGGSGRAAVASPAEVTVTGETAEAVIVWSSPYYSYMVVDDIRYEPQQTEGNSTFKIPVKLDQDMQVTACTEAMSEPHEIEYTLHFDIAARKGA